MTNFQICKHYQLYQASKSRFHSSHNKLHNYAEIFTIFPNMNAVYNSVPCWKKAAISLENSETHNKGILIALHRSWLLSRGNEIQCHAETKTSQKVKDIGGKTNDRGGKIEKRLHRNSRLVVEWGPGEQAPWLESSEHNSRRFSPLS